MTVAWVGGCTRAKALASRRLGARAARELASQPSLEAAVASLSASPYGRGVHAGQSLEDAQRAVAETLLWNLRVLAGWLPGEGADMVRALVGWFEIANIDEHLQALGGVDDRTYFALGGLATAWPRFAATRSIAQVRRVMETSRWGDAAEDTPWSIHLQLQASWAARVYDKLPPARPWVTAAAASLVSRVTLLEGRRIPSAVAAALGRALPGLDVVAAAFPEPMDYPTFLARLPAQTRELLRETAETAGVSALRPDRADSPGELETLAGSLWRTEVRWWSRMERDAFALLRSSVFGVEPIVGIAGVLAADAWRVRAALAAAAYGTAGLETFDAMA